MILLWTDILLLSLVSTISILIIVNRKQPQLRQIYKTVLNNKIALCSLIVLSVFFTIAILDSIHFKNQNQNIVSLLDQLLKPMHTMVEKTYSAPFATHSLNKEINDNNISDYPLLKKAGRHLKNPENKNQDLLIKSISAIFIAIVVWLLITKFIAKKLSISVKFTMLIILILLSFCLYLSQYYHIFGTDKVGHDVLYQAIKSIRTGLIIGTVTTLFMVPLAITMGIMSGYLGGWVDDIIQYTYTTINSIPGVLLIAAGILTVQVYISNHPESFSNIVEQSDLRLLFVCGILALTSWTGLCRILRSEVLKIRESDFVLAAQTLGLSRFRIMTRHLLPNVMHIVLISVILDFSSLILAEAVLSYIGIGVDPNTYSWGNMINSARMEMAREPIIWWSLVAAFIFMFTLVLAANLFADVVRAALDPRTSR